MGSHRILRIPVTAVVLMVWMSGFCGVTGKVRGRVKDSTTGVPLYGANVMVSKEWVNGVEIDFPGTYLGAAADAGGEYIILRVPPGIYSIEVSMMGYSRLTQQQVKINADRTTVVDFSLVELVLEGQSVVVQAERDLVQLDVSGTENFVTSEEYEKTPFANRMEDMLSLQSG